MARKTQAVAVEEPKTKIEYAAQLYNQGHAVAEIAKALDISPRTVRGYIWRTNNPEKFKAIVANYFAKRKGKEKKPAKVPQEASVKPIPKWKAPAGKAKQSKVGKAQAEQVAQKAKEVVQQVKKQAKKQAQTAKKTSR